MRTHFFVQERKTLLVRRSEGLKSRKECCLDLDGEGEGQSEKGHSFSLKSPIGISGRLSS